MLELWAYREEERKGGTEKERNKRKRGKFVCEVSSLPHFLRSSSVGQGDRLG
jgi:hypothetical protein